MHLKDRLIEKGWSRKDIKKTLSIIEKAKKNKHPKIKILDKSVFWISLILAIVGNFIISIALIPVLLALNGFQLYIVVLTLAFSFGLLFELLIRTIGHLQTKHHIFLSIIIPIIALINFFIIVLVANSLEEILKIENTQNPILVGIVYAVGFILPYSVYQLFLKDK